MSKSSLGSFQNAPSARDALSDVGAPSPTQTSYLSYWLTHIPSTQRPDHEDHIAVYRDPYYHHGIYILNEEVVDFEEEGVRRISYATFKMGDKVYKVNHKSHSVLPPGHVCTNAISCVSSGYGNYNLFGNNCEHFATQMKTGKAFSEQSDASGVFHNGRYNSNPT